MRQLHAVEQTGTAIRRGGCDSSLKVVHHLQEATGEFLQCKLLGIVGFALDALLKVIHIGISTGLYILDLCFKLRDARLQGCHIRGIFAGNVRLHGILLGRDDVFWCILCFCLRHYRPLR